MSYESAGGNHGSGMAHCGLCCLRKVIRGHEVWCRDSRCEGTPPAWPTVKGIELMAKTAADTSRGLIHKLSHQPADRRCLKKECLFQVVHLVPFHFNVTNMDWNPCQ